MEFLVLRIDYIPFIIILPAEEVENKNLFVQTFDDQRDTMANTLVFAPSIDKYSSFCGARAQQNATKMHFMKINGFSVTYAITWI
jgi:hypothetical protein